MDTTQIIIHSLQEADTRQAAVDIVEYKGIGHPDTICDLLAESLSVALCRRYLEEFGQVMHYNVDKVLLCAGKSRPKFNGGDIIEPIEIYFAGRAVKKNGARDIGVDALAIALTQKWFEQHIPLLDTKTLLKVTPKIREGSAELVELFGRQREIALANDTSIGVGYAPLTRTDQLVIAIKDYLNSDALREQYPCIGRDIKVMGVEINNVIDLTIAIAFIDRYISSLDDYRTKKNELTALLTRKANETAGCACQVVVNAADDIENGSIYLTVSGTSAEAGDDGQVGRGNRVNQLITPYRPMSLEATAGKNPISHVGKIYNIFSHELAHTLYENIAELEEVRCYIVSTIGIEITRPQVVHLQIRSGAAMNSTLANKIKAIVHYELSTLPQLWKRLTRDKIDGML